MDRQAAINELKEIIDEEFSVFRVDALTMAIDALKAQPTTTDLPEEVENTDGLKPCPFCGSQPTLRKSPLWFSSRGYHGCYQFDVHCEKCGCKLDFYNNDTIYRSEDEAERNAIDTWNRRTE